MLLDPPPLKWSALKYGLQAEGGSRCERSDIPPKRSFPSCARWMCWSHKEPRWRTRSARLGSPKSAPRRVAGWRDLRLSSGGADHHRELAAALQFGPAACLSGLPTSGGTVNLIGSGRDQARDEAARTNGYAQAATPVTAAQV